MRRVNFWLVVAAFALPGLFALPADAQDNATGATVTVEPYRATNVRSGPSVTYDVVAHLEPGRRVRAIGRSDESSNWLQVDLGSQVGWVAYFTVAVTGDPSRLDIVFAPEPEPDATAAAPVPPETAAQRATSNLYVTAYRRVNIRSGPGTEFNVLGVLVPGQTADIIGTSGEDNEWLQIRYDGADGWVAYFVVTVSGDVSILDGERTLDSELQANMELGGIVQNQVIVITRFNTNLRAAPQFGSQVVTVIPYDTTLQAVARAGGQQWLQVEYEGTRGWLISSLVNIGASDVDALPVMPLPAATLEPQG